MNAPIVDAVLSALSRGTAEPYEMDAQGAARLRTVLVSLKAQSGFKQALTELVLFARFIEQDRKSPRAARAILQTAEAVITAP